MRRTWFLTCLWLTMAWPLVVAAQPAPAPESDAEVGAEETTDTAASEPAAPEQAEQLEAEEPEPEPAEEPVPVEEEESSLQPPELEPLDVPPPPQIEPEPEPEPDLPDPAEAAELLDESQPEEEEEVDSEKRWTLPRPVFSMHGYFRVRANLMRKLALGRPADQDRLQTGSRSNIDPFYAYRPRDSSPNPESAMGDTVAGGCGKSAGEDGRCSRDLQVGTDMRLRLKPEVALGEDVRLKMWIDVFDNVVFGSANRDPNERIDLGDTIVARRAWGEVSDRDLGELRFGRMGADWGLGILDNGGDRDGIDSDFSSDIDRIMGITNLAGFYLMGAYDWAAQGDFLPGSASPSGVPIDLAQKDDLNQITLAVARRESPEKEEAALARGDVVFNVGTYFVWRKQLIENNPDYPDEDDEPFRRLNERQFIPDLWLRLQWQGLRLEMESVFVAGTIEGGCPRLEGDPINGNELPPPGTGTCKLREFGTALEAEYRLIDDRLGIYFYSGFASGDKNAYGVAATNNPSQQRVSADNPDPSKAGYDDVISTYSFHPDYRVDLILWRSIMRQVAGAYYFKPGVSFDFMRNPFGRRLGGKFDVIYSRASRKRQVWGQNGNMGLELDVSLYYRSEDGPDPLDGFYATLDGAVLFPLKGLQYRDENNEGAYAGGDAAIMFRTVLGIAF